MFPVEDIFSKKNNDLSSQTEIWQISLCGKQVNHVFATNISIILKQL